MVQGLVWLLGSGENEWLTKVMVSFSFRDWSHKE